MRSSPSRPAPRPFMAQQWIDVIRDRVSDLPFGDLVLTHYHAVRTLGAIRLRRAADRCARRRRQALIEERGDGGLGQRAGPHAAPLRRCRDDPRPDATDRHLRRRHDASTSAIAASSCATSAAATPRATSSSGCRRSGSASPATSSRRRPLRTWATPTSPTGRPAPSTTWPRSAPSSSSAAVARSCAASDVRDRDRGHPRLPAHHARGHAGRPRRRRDASRRRSSASTPQLAPRYAGFPIFEHTMPFNVQRTWDELDGIDHPRIWTAERDREVWDALSRLIACAGDRLTQTSRVVGAGAVGLTLAGRLAQHGAAVEVFEASAAPRARSGRGPSACSARRSRSGRGSASASAVARARHAVAHRAHLLPRARCCSRRRLPGATSEHFPPFVNISQSEVEERARRRGWRARRPSPARAPLHRPRRRTPTASTATFETDGGTVTRRSALPRRHRWRPLGRPPRRRDRLRRLHLRRPVPDRRHPRRAAVHEPAPLPLRPALEPGPPGPHPPAARRRVADRLAGSGRDRCRRRARQRRPRPADPRRSSARRAPYELVWMTGYRFSQRLADAFRVGRVFLAGDAAHVMAPFGARGLNSGRRRCREPRLEAGQPPCAAARRPRCSTRYDGRAPAGGARRTSRRPTPRCGSWRPTATPPEPGEPSCCAWLLTAPGSDRA